MASEPTGVELIAAERRRQIAVEGWTAEHDDQHVNGQLAWAATCYAAPSTVFTMTMSRGGRNPDDGLVAWNEPWPREQTMNRGEPCFAPWHRPVVDRVTELVKAGALIAAEIDRLKRAEVSDVQ